MKVLTGVDLVYIPEFITLYNNGLIDKAFHKSEISKSDIRMAGLFAAKEAVIKCVGLPIGSWQKIRIFHKKTGKPIVHIDSGVNSIKSIDLSISHHNDYVVAFCVVLN